MIVRALAIIGLASAIGLAHSMVRERPIRLGSSNAPAATVESETDSGADAVSHTGADAGTAASGDGAPAFVYDPDRVAGLSGEALLDEPVLEGMITLRDASALFDGGASFIDARREDVHAEGHIPGSIRMTADEVFQRAEELFAFDPELPVVIYCEGGTCDASHNVKNRLVNYGPDLGLVFGRIEIMGLGYEEWARAGLPTSAGATP